MKIGSNIAQLIAVNQAHLMFAFFMFVIVEFVFFMVFILGGFFVVASGLRSLLVEFLMSMLASLLLFAAFVMLFVRVRFVVMGFLVATLFSVMTYLQSQALMFCDAFEAVKPT